MAALDERAGGVAFFHAKFFFFFLLVCLLFCTVLFAVRGQQYRLRKGLRKAALSAVLFSRCSQPDSFIHYLWRVWRDKIPPKPALISVIFLYIFGLIANRTVPSTRCLCTTCSLHISLLGETGGGRGAYLVFLEGVCLFDACLFRICSCGVVASPAGVYMLRFRCPRRGDDAWVHSRGSSRIWFALVNVGLARSCDWRRARLAENAVRAASVHVGFLSPLLRLRHSFVLVGPSIEAIP